MVSLKRPSITIGHCYGKECEECEGTIKWPSLHFEPCKIIGTMLP